MNVSESTSGLVSCPSLHAAWSSQSATTNFRLVDDLCYLLNYSHRWRSYNFWFTLEIITCSDNYRLMLWCRMTTAGLFQSETAAIALLHPFSFNACSLVVCLYFDYFIFSFSAVFLCHLFWALTSALKSSSVSEVEMKRVMDRWSSPREDLYLYQHWERLFTNEDWSS